MTSPRSVLSRITTLAMIGLVTQAAPAQFGPRSTMTSDGPDGRTVLSFVQPDIRVVTAPRISLPDLPDASRILLLSDDQVGALRAMIETYLERLAGIEWDRPLVERGPGASRSGTDQDRRQQFMQLIERELGEAGIEMKRVRGGDLDLSIGVSISQEDGSDAAHARVEVSIGPRDGVLISAEERAKLAAAAERLADALDRSGLLSDTGPIAERSDGAGERESDRRQRMRTEIEQMHRTVRSHRRAHDALYSSFVADAHSILAESQREAWPALERLLRRRQTISRGVLSGESVDLVALATTFTGDNALPPPVEDLLSSYDLDLDPALIARNAALDSVDGDIDLAILDGDAARIVRAADAAIAACVRVREINLRYADEIMHASPDFGDAWRSLVMKAAFPDLRWRGLSDEAFDRLASIDGLPPDLHGPLAEMRAAWAVEWSDARDSVMRATLRSQPAERRASLRGIVESFDPERAERMAAGTDPVPAARQRQSALDLRTLRTLRAIVPSGIAASLPVPVDAGNDPVIRVERDVPEGTR